MRRGQGRVQRRDAHERFEAYGLHVISNVDGTTVGIGDRGSELHEAVADKTQPHLLQKKP